MRVKIFCIMFLVLLNINALAEEGPLYIYDALCEKDGSIEIIFDSSINNKILTKDVNIKAQYVGDLIVKKSNFNITGKWGYDSINNKRISFISEEVLFDKTGEYLITADYLYDNEFYSVSYKTRCPGFEFSCKLIGVYVDSCKNINNERFEASVRIYGLGDVTKENLTLDNNVQFMLQAESSYEDYKGKISERGSLPKGIVINNLEYGQYYFNITNFDNKIKSFVAKIIGINYIEGGCVSYPNISLYSYKECTDIIVEEVKKQEEKEESPPPPTGQIVKQEILEKLEKNINTKKETKWPLIILITILTLCSGGIIYIISKRKFNKESNF